MTASDLNNFLLEAEIPFESLFLRDSTYRLPNRKWIFHEFASAFESFKSSLGSNQYTAESNDCDDFTDLAVWYARFLHARGRTTDSIAFGSFVYTRKDGICHSICCAVANDPEPTLVFFEPQNSTEVFLTPNEISSCDEARF